MLMKKTQIQSTCGLISKDREFLFFFGTTTGFWAKKLSLFSHSFVAEFISETEMIKFEPLFSQGSLELITFPFEVEENFTVIYVKTRPRNNKNKLVKPTFQTCSTLIQYMAGIDLGCITPQGLYEALTQSNPSWLMERGVMEVSKWVK
jgi:hypothetical protein